MSKHNVTAETN